MKQHLWIVNLLLLAINIVLFIIFIAYTVIGLKPIGNYISTGDIQTQLVIALVYEFCFFIISAVFAKVMNKDLSYKGTDVLKCIPKRVIVTVCLVALALIAYTAVYLRYLCGICGYGCSYAVFNFNSDGYYASFEK